MPKQVQRNKPKSVSLVLGSGGARGLAHIGVIQELEARGFKVQAIAGSSMGALVGGIYALGKLQIYADWVSGLEQSDVLWLIDWSFSGGGIIRGQKVINKLRELVGEEDIERLPIAFTAVAVDIERGKEIWFHDGPLFDAIRASIAIPGLFTPHHYRGLTLVDGGLLNPVPVAPTLSALTDLTIVVDVNGPAEDLTPEVSPGNDHGRFLERLRSYAEALGLDINGDNEGLALSDILMRSFDTMQAALTRQHLAVFHPDVVIRIPKNACMVHEFYQAKPIIQLGRERAKAALDEWL
ncbi:NTE family protein [Ectothiorhodosinus mongolicus]|uniref:NTE family protein n=1 Tax=Ectothiorhodosinus mongolicus TaxID=233100 RepID=A0A1R3W1E3_9GAMM|nr:patatin-like phospholipase family protein [Ectothiorhodosinus mongolicus]ULX57181.1 serine protease [Ectothiorhodosinus mongolicus]SIT70297.1 NTE family protein [Ectothiorhodosinus mongolicus]